MQELLIRLVRYRARYVLDAVLRPRGGNQLWPVAIWFLLPAPVRKVSAHPNSFKPFGAVPTGFSVLRFTSHFSYSLLVSDSGPLVFTNPQDIMGGSTHKPYVVMDAHRPNHAAKIDGRCWLLTVSWQAGHKVVQQSTAEKLAGPWTVRPEPFIIHGTAGDFDAKHVDAVTGFHFPERGEILYFYMGYPEQAQARRISPLGSAQAVAVQRAADSIIRKLGEVLPPCQAPGHWASGWVGGLQILPSKTHRWIAIINASPTAPRHDATEVFREEPPPSLGGFAFCDEEWPVRGWQWSPQPIEWIQDIPLQARALGEGTNLWRQHILALPDGRLFLHYNSGFYGQEQLYAKIAEGRKTKPR